MFSFFSGDKALWKWIETNGQTQENLLPNRFHLKEVVSLTRESAQNSVDAFLLNSKDIDKNYAVIKYKFFTSDKDLSKYFSGLVEARKVLSKDQRWGKKYTKQFDFKNCSWLMIQDANTKGLEGDINSRISDFWGFVLNWGRSNKTIQSGASSGSKGVGRLTFPLFSGIECVFALTSREDGEYLVGTALLNTHFDEEKNKFFDSSALFVKSAKDGGVWNLHDDLVKSFKDDFQIPDIKYRDKPSYGTTLIIPFPKIDEDKNPEDCYRQIQASLIETYAPLILRDQFKPEISDEVINYENLPRLTSSVKDLFSVKELKENGEDYIDFLQTAILENEAEEYEAEIDLNKHCVLDIKDEKIITPQQRLLINNALDNQEVVNVKINFPIVINGKEHPTYIEACLRRPKNDSKGFEAYYRNGMLMIAQEKKLDCRFHAALLCKDPVIARYLNIFEDEGHTKWVMGQQQKNEAEDKGYDKKYFVRPVKLCMSVLLDLTKIFNEKNQEVNFKSLTQFFALPEKKKINPNIDPNDDIKPKKKSYMIQQRNKGFKIMARTDSPAPKKISIRFKAKHHPYQKKPAVNENDALFNTENLDSLNCSYEIVDEKTESGKLIGKMIVIDEIKKDFWFEIKDWESNLEISCTLSVEDSA